MIKQQIWHYHLEIQEWIKNGSVHAFFNRSRINDFYKEHQARLQKIIEEITAVQKHHMVFEQDKNMNDVQKRDDKGGIIWLEGKTEADYNAMYYDLMMQDVTTKFVLDKVKLQVVEKAEPRKEDESVKETEQTVSDESQKITGEEKDNG